MHLRDPAIQAGSKPFHSSKEGLPTALETAEALFNNVFRHFGLPEDIMFIFRVWCGFFRLLGAYPPYTYLRAYCHNHQHNWSQYLPVHARLPITTVTMDRRAVREIPPPPEVNTDDSIFQVREIANSRQRGGHLQYLVNWEGYGPEERSWVVRDDILDPSLLEEYHQVHPERPTSRDRGCPRLETPVCVWGGADNLTTISAVCLVLPPDGANHEAEETVSRIRFMLRDVVNLRQDKWEEVLELLGMFQYYIV
ncbi:hypothetical protein QTP86_005081 [Hemibagrus guttatus]|nr:hypothetical protein QTP86_005081 [Hemibagrus guttatus]